MNEFDEIMKTVNESFQIVEKEKEEKPIQIKRKRTLEDSTMYKYYEAKKNLLVPMLHFFTSLKYFLKSSLGIVITSRNHSLLNTSLHSVILPLLLISV